MGARNSSFRAEHGSFKRPSVTVLLNGTSEHAALWSLRIYVVVNWLKIEGMYMFSACEVGNGYSTLAPPCLMLLLFMFYGFFTLSCLPSGIILDITYKQAS